MLGAIKSVKEGMSLTAAAECHGVPLSTLKDRFNGKVVHGTNPGPRLYLSSNEEAELAAFLVEWAKIGYGETRRDENVSWSCTCRKARTSLKISF